MTDLVYKDEVISLIKWAYTDRFLQNDPVTDRFVLKELPKLINNLGGVSPKTIGCAKWVKSENIDYWTCTGCEKDTLLLHPLQSEEVMLRENPHCKWCGAQMVRN